MQDKTYRKLCMKLGGALILNHVLLYAFQFISMLTVPAFEGVIKNISQKQGIDYLDLYYAVEETAYLISYLAAFMIPAFFFMIISRREGREPMRLEVKLRPDTPLVVIASIGLVYGASYINSLMVSFIDFSALFPDEPMNTPIKILMSFISIAVVPAVCEEFLYRGCVLSNLLPYGKTTAVIASALLFALMHGNFAQFFYTFIAGLVMGAVYIETGSIWPSTFIHLFNNFLSIVQQVILENAEGSPAYNAIGFCLNLVIPLAGLAAAGWLIYDRSKRGLHIDAKPTKNIKLESSALVKGFLNPVMIVHIVLSLVMALYIVLAAIGASVM